MIERSIEVAVPAQRAFQIWTEQLELWWPAGHRPSRDPAAVLSLEAGEGGRMLQRAPDGQEFVLGRVLAWDPPHAMRLAWFLGSGADAPTEVEIRFVTLDEARTRVEVRHGRGRCPEDRYGGIVAKFSAAWPMVLDAFDGVTASR